MMHGPAGPYRIFLHASLIPPVYGHPGTLTMRTILTLLLLLGTLLARAADGPAPSPVQARAQVDEARGLLLQSFDDPDKVVDAAVLFVQALPAFESANLIDEVTGIKADIYWCKKRMTLDQINAFLARKGGQGTAAKDAITRIDTVANAPVAADQAQTFFDRAQAFAAANPTKHQQIATRFYEVAERFAGSPQAVQAQRQSLEAQRQVEKAEAEARSKAHENLFTRRIVSGTAAIPPADAVRKARDGIRTTFRLEYLGATTPAAHADLARQLRRTARGTGDDPTMRWGLLVEARDQATQAREPLLALMLVDDQATAFAGVDVVKERRAALNAMSAMPAARAMLRLLDAPDDADANATAGRWMVLEGEAPDQGFALLVRGSDKTWARIAAMEQAAPKEAPQRSELADLWYGQWKTLKDLPQRMVCATRGVEWYEDAFEAKLQGMTEVTASKHCAELEQFLDANSPRKDENANKRNPNKRKKRRNN